MVSLSAGGATLYGKAGRLRLRVVGSRQDVQPEPEAPLAGKANYFIGEPSHWVTDVPIYRRVRYRNIRPGVDWVFHGDGKLLEYDFELKPQARLDDLRVAWEGADHLERVEGGALRWLKGGAAAVSQAPKVFQEGAEGWGPLPGAYRIGPHGEIAFQVLGRDPRRRLLIDPVLAYSSFIGGSSEDTGTAIAVDPAGNAYVTGQTFSRDFPIRGPIQPSLPDGGVGNAFITKLNPAGDTIIYSTYLGGSGGEQGNGIALDGLGDAYVTGHTFSKDFPTANAFQSTAKGAEQAFVAELNATGNALLFSTYLGGSNAEDARAIAVDKSGSAYVTGSTTSHDFPVTAVTFQSTLRSAISSNAFVTKLSPGGSALVYSTYLGGNGSDIGNGIGLAGGAAIVAGSTTSTNFPLQTPLQSTLKGGGNAFVTELSPAGNPLLYSTYLGGSANDAANGIAVDGTGNAYVAGATTSTDFPTRSPFQSNLKGSTSAFVAKLTASGGLFYSTYLSGTTGDFAAGIAVDAAGRAYLTGTAHSSDFPTLAAFQPAMGGAGSDAFVTELAASGDSLIYSSFLGGAAQDNGMGIAVDPAGAAYVTGLTVSSNFPTQGGFQNSFGGGPDDGFVTKVNGAASDSGVDAGPLLDGGAVTSDGGPATADGGTRDGGSSAPKDSFARLGCSGSAGGLTSIGCVWAALCFGLSRRRGTGRRPGFPAPTASRPPCWSRSARRRGAPSPRPSSRRGGCPSR